MFSETPPGRRIWVIWRYDREEDEISDVFGELGDVPIFGLRCGPLGRLSPSTRARDSIEC